MKRSIIIYTNNSERYIGRLLDSVLKQMEEDDELVIVDDMSTDETIPITVGKVGYMWADEEHYKLYINTDNKGKRKSIEMAKKIAKGDFKFIVNKKGRVRL
jgi:glycosyltransferase involved in cell wall biosynthesis